MLVYLLPLWKGDRLATQTAILSPSFRVILSVAKNLMALLATTTPRHCEALRGAKQTAEAISKTGLPRLRLAMTQGKREEPPEIRGALGVSEVLPIKLESGYSSGSDYQDKQGNNQHPTNTDYDIYPSRGYRCCCR